MTFINPLALDGEPEFSNASRLLSHDYARRAPIERLVMHLWDCGPRAIAEFLDALAVENGIGAAIAAKLQEYRRLSPEMLAAVGADKFVPNPTREIAP